MGSSREAAGPGADSRPQCIRHELQPRAGTAGSSRGCEPDVCCGSGGSNGRCTPRGGTAARSKGAKPSAGGSTVGSSKASRLPGPFLAGKGAAGSGKPCRPAAGGSRRSRLGSQPCSSSSRSQPGAVRQDRTGAHPPCHTRSSRDRSDTASRSVPASWEAQHTVRNHLSPAAGSIGHSSGSSSLTPYCSSSHKAAAQARMGQAASCAPKRLGCSNSSHVQLHQAPQAHLSTASHEPAAQARMCQAAACAPRRLGCSHGSHVPLCRTSEAQLS